MNRSPSERLVDSATGGAAVDRGSTALDLVPARAKEAFAILLVTHFAVDCFSSTLPTIQPILVDRHGLSLAQAGMLGACWLLASAVLQLPFGLLSDRIRSRHFTTLSPLVAAVCLGTVSLAPTLVGVACLLVAGGVGVAAFHPHSTSRAGHIGGERRGLATAVFITAGTAGLGVGPLYLASAIERLGFERLWVSALPVVALTPLLLWRMPPDRVSEQAGTRAVDWPLLRSRWRPLLMHYALVVLRSIAQVGMAQYLSLYMVQVRGADFRSASVALAVYFLSTSSGAFLGGAAADRIGGRRVIITSCAASGPLMAAFLATDGWMSVAVLFIAGTCLLAPIPVNVVMAGELVPSQAGTAAALMMGFGWGLAGIAFVPLAGVLADWIGLAPVLWAFTLLPAAGLPIAFALPRSRSAKSALRKDRGR